MQQQMFRDVLWAVVESSDRGDPDIEGMAYLALLSAHPYLARSRFDEIVEMLVRTEHLRRWRGPSDATGSSLGPGGLLPTAKARLQFALAD